MEQQKITLGFKKGLTMVGPYIAGRLTEQLKAVALIAAYLLLFQVLVLGQPLLNALPIIIGISAVVFGLAFFMEGLMIGLMPLGELLGTQLPKKSKLWFILFFGFLLGIGATLAEPAIGALKFAGSSVKAWDSPVLFYLLNGGSQYLVMAVGIGVGLAVLIGMLRFMYGWSLKPFIFIVIPILLAVTLYASLNPALSSVIGLAWDTGGITTGPVTVPLVLALGIGLSRMSKKSSSGAGGFGVVTMASALPILTVMILAIGVAPSLPLPNNQKDFFKTDKAQLAKLFGTNELTEGYILNNGTEEIAQAWYGEGDIFNRSIQLAGPAKPKNLNLTPPNENSTLADKKSYEESQGLLAQYNAELKLAVDLRQRVFGGNGDSFFKWIDSKAPTRIKDLLVYREVISQEDLDRIKLERNQSISPDIVPRNALGAVQAIVPLVGFLLLVYFIVVRLKLPRLDESILGIVFAILGMAVFSIGIELGLANMGNQVGGNVPALYKGIASTSEPVQIKNFDPSMVQEAIAPDGTSQHFFYYKDGSSVKPVPYVKENYDSSKFVYNYRPQLGPVFGNFVGGIIVTLLFGFVLGFAATLAEPALNALGRTVEDLTVGTFKKKLLMNAVAIGVGVGIAIGVLKLLFDIPMIWLLGPPYLILLLMTAVSSEDYVNIGWDSAGVTTGPVTVPLVLAMGLGIGGQMGVIEGFGILAAASVYPILAVLAVGLVVQSRRKKLVEIKEGV